MIARWGLGLGFVRSLFCCGSRAFAPALGRFTSALTLAFATCSAQQPAEDESPASYRVMRRPQARPLQADWDLPEWRDVAAIELRRHMGERPSHFPRTQAKAMYDDDAIYVMFRVEDRYIRAVAERHQASICEDSCVEFFFTPGTQEGIGYFNLEMNCGGTLLLHYQRVPWQGQQPFADEEIAQIEITHSLPKIVEPEISRPTTWVVAYRIPIGLLEKYYPEPIARPAPGVRWRANFYKCGDKTSHPHWLTWAPMSTAQPDFHRPQDFGELEFQ